MARKVTVSNAEPLSSNINLPPEIWLSILSMMSRKDLAPLRFVSHEWQNLILAIHRKRLQQKRQPFKVGDKIYLATIADKQISSVQFVRRIIDRQEFNYMFNIEDSNQNNNRCRVVSAYFEKHPEIKRGLTESIVAEVVSMTYNRGRVVYTLKHSANLENLIVFIEKVFRPNSFYGLSEDHFSELMHCDVIVRKETAQLCFQKKKGSNLGRNFTNLAFSRVPQQELERQLKKLRKIVSRL